MPVEVIMPKVDMDMATGRIMTWHVAPGETVAKGDPLFDIETDKAAMEVEAPSDGLLHHPLPEGTEVPIGKPVAWLYAIGEAVGEAPAGAAPAAEAVPEREAASEAEKVQAEEPERIPAMAGDAEEKPRATPKARRLAREGGLSLDGLTGSGPRGRLQAGDITALLEAPARAEAAAPARFTAETGPLSVTRAKGGTGTPVVLLHGFASDGTSWAPLEQHLRHRPLIRIELPAHGKSPKLRIADFAALAAEMRHAFDALGLERAHLVGHSLGGALALALADTRERKVDSLTLIAPAGLGPDINGAALSGIGRATRAESLGPWLRELVSDETLVTPAWVRSVMAGRDSALRAAQEALAEVLFPDGVQAFDLRAALGRVGMPARVVWGKADRIIPWRHALQAPGHVALHLFDGIGHMPQIEAPETLGKLLAHHL